MNTVTSFLLALGLGVVSLVELDGADVSLCCSLVVAWVTRASLALILIHRGFAHRAFVWTGPWGLWIAALFATMAHQGSPRQWAIVHQHHHAYCDTVKDPHSQVVMGLPAALYATLTISTHRLLPLADITLLNDVNIEFWDRRFFAFNWAEHIMWFVIGGWRWLFVSVVSAVLSIMGACLFNVMFHLDNTTVHGKVCKAINITVIWLPLWVFGENNHKDHHQFPNKARRSQYDPIYWVVLVPLEYLGMIQIVG